MRCGRRRGPKPRPVDPRVKQLEAENRRLPRVQRAETIITLQKKVAEAPGDPPETPRQLRRARLMIAIEAVTTTGATAALCQSVGLARATLYRRRQPARSSTPTPRAASSRALGPAERQAVLDVSTAQRAVRRGSARRSKCRPARVEEQTYLCSTRTMYRILDAAEEVRERRAQARHPAYAKPELVATAAESAPSGRGHITQLKGPIPYLYYSLYVILDLFSRYVVGWMVAGGRERPPGPAPDRGDVPQATHRSARQRTIHARPRRSPSLRSKLVARRVLRPTAEASH